MRPAARQAYLADLERKEVAAIAWAARLAAEAEAAEQKRTEALARRRARRAAGRMAAGAATA